MVPWGLIGYLSDPYSADKIYTVAIHCITLICLITEAFVQLATGVS